MDVGAKVKANEIARWSSRASVTSSPSDSVQTRLASNPFSAAKLSQKELHSHDADRDL